MPQAETASDIALTLVPEGSGWAAALARARARIGGAADPVGPATRRALRLPTDRAIVMAGHQPGFWHMGILAKWMALETLAAQTGAAQAWVVVDQSPGAGADFDYPASTDGVLRRATLRLGSAEAPPAAQPAAQPTPPTDAAGAGVAGALTRLCGLLAGHADEPSLARQLHAACCEALGPGPVELFASELGQTAAFGSLVRAMRDDPIACVRLYNEAAAAHPASGIRALAAGSGAVELPLWEKTATPDRPGPWRTVMSDRLADLPDGQLAPRALPMTGLLRRWACDLFIHGSGGGATGQDSGYDRVTEAWFGRWLGVDASDLAPSVVATATMRLAFEGFDPPTTDEIAQARAEAHRAEHDPSLLGDADLGERKRSLAQRMASLPRGSDERAEVFRQMQALRAGSAQEHAESLRALRELAEALSARAGEAEVAADRTWSFLLHGPDAIQRLRDAVRSAMR
ncbi:MAG: hypothetical protein IPJ41_16630 [Phycisphaerales bacterium]|nr:hypothetical protein [Phycisphaerales bacterium]